MKICTIGNMVCGSVCLKCAVWWISTHFSKPPPEINQTAHPASHRTNFSHFSRVTGNGTKQPESHSESIRFSDYDISNGFPHTYITCSQTIANSDMAPKIVLDGPMLKQIKKERKKERKEINKENVTILGKERKKKERKHVYFRDTLALASRDQHENHLCCVSGSQQALDQ